MEPTQDIKIVIISSFAEDEVFYSESGKTENYEGGPALWITKSLESLNYSPKVYTGRKKAVIKITREKDEETGTIDSVESILLPTDTSADLFIISTISDEFDLKEIKKINGIIALDIQGYVRKLKGINKKLMIPQEVADKISIIKGTENEISYLEDSFVNDQKKRVFIITKGERGFDIFCESNQYEFLASPVSAKNTIGAGDSLLAVFAAEFLRTEDVLVSGKFAKIFVENFLKAKSQGFNY